MKYFIKNITLLFTIFFLGFGYIAMFEYGRESQKKADAILIKQAFEDGKNWLPKSMIKADSLINNSKYHNYLQGFKYYKMLDNSGSERLK